MSQNMTRRGFLKQAWRATALTASLAGLSWLGYATRQQQRIVQPLVTIIPYDQLIQPSEYHITKGEDTLATFLDRITEDPHGPAILSMVKEYALLSGIPPELSIAILAQETGGYLQKKSEKGAIPPMHVMPKTAKTLETRIREGEKMLPAFEEAYARQNVHLTRLVTETVNPAFLLYAQATPVFDPAILPRDWQKHVEENKVGWKLNPPVAFLNRRFKAYKGAWNGTLREPEENIKASMLSLTELLQQAAWSTARLREKLDNPAYRTPETILAAAYNAGRGVLTDYEAWRAKKKHVKDEGKTALAWLNAWSGGGQAYEYALHVGAFTHLLRKPDWQAWLESIPPSERAVVERLKHSRLEG